MQLCKFAAVLVAVLTLFALEGCTQKGATAGDPPEATASAVSNLGVTTHLAEVQRLATNGDAAAQLQLGRMYTDGDGVPRDLAKAIEWTQKAAEQGNLAAQTEVALLYLRGTAPFDHELGFKWANRAAERGQPLAQWMVGSAYHYGRGTSKNTAKAAEWYRKAAEQDVAMAQDGLGDLYWDGTGVPQDYGQAMDWYRKAAEQGYAAAQAHLSKAYFSLRVVPKGHTVREIYVTAAMWAILAKANGNEDAKSLLQDIEHRMPPHEIADAQARARVWWEKHNTESLDTDS